ncbi:MAG: hypothetical protein K8S14_09230 [Actinomycetia bacterium]|nr:hypothetical protein [Actinomycetes bacterium]
MSMTKKRILLFVIITIVLVMVCTGVLYAFGGAIQFQDRNWVVVWGVRSNFYANRLSPSSVTSDHGTTAYLTPNKNIRRARVKIWEEYNGNPYRGPYYKYSANAPGPDHSGLISTGWLYLWDTLEWEGYITHVGLYCWYF